GGNGDVGRDHFSLHEELSPDGVDADNLRGWRGVRPDELEAGTGRLGLEVCGALHGGQLASLPRPRIVVTGRQQIHRQWRKKHEPERLGLSGGWGWRVLRRV